MRNKFLLLALCAAVCSTLFHACSCEEEFPADPATVDIPLQVIREGFDNGGFLYFNRPVDTTSVIPGKTLLIEGAKFTGFMQWNAEKTYVAISNCEIYNPDLAAGATIPYSFNFVLDGDASDGMAVRGANGSVLDGDRDNTAGGNFEKTYQAFNCQNIYTLRVSNYESGTFTAFSGPKSINQDSSYFFDISFSNPLDPATAVYGDAIFLENTQTKQRVPGRLEVIYRDVLRFTSTQKASVLRQPPNSGFGYRFIVRSGGAAPLRSVYGATLTSDFILNVQLQ